MSGDRHIVRLTTLGTFTMAVQGFYYLITGIWPVLHRTSFEMVTGPKTDYWLVVMVGLITVAIGVALLTALHQPLVTRAIWRLAVCAALAYASVDVAYYLDGVIAKIYLADAGAELMFVAGMMTGRRTRRS